MAEEQKEEQTKEALDFTTLEERLGELDAAAFMSAERACRMVADPTPDIAQSAAFCARLAAMAMGVPYERIKAMKLQEFASVTMRTKSFLLAPLGEMVIQRNS